MLPLSMTLSDLTPISRSRHFSDIEYHRNGKKLSEEMQTLCAGCSKTEPNIFARRRTPSRGAGRPKFNQLEMVTTFTYKPSLVRIDARNFKLSW